MADLKAAFTKFANKISGTSYVDNMKDPNSAAYKIKQSTQDVAQQNKKPNLLPKQQVYGVPGISNNSQLPPKLR